jgi:hypothetical protein
MDITKMLTERQRALKEQKAMKVVRVLLSKYNLEEDADKLGHHVQYLQDIVHIDQEFVDSFKLKGTVAEYMHIIKQETGKDVEDYKLELS